MLVRRGMLPQLHSASRISFTIAAHARVDIPALFFSTNLHPDHHTPRDEPKIIDVSKLVWMAKWMYATGWLVAQADQRPTIDPGFKVER